MVSKFRNLLMIALRTVSSAFFSFKSNAVANETRNYNPKLYNLSHRNAYAEVPQTALALKDIVEADVGVELEMLHVKICHYYNGAVIQKT